MLWDKTKTDTQNVVSRKTLTTVVTNIFAFKYNRIVSELKTYELTSEVLTVCKQLVFTAFRYPNLSETTNGRKKGNNNDDNNNNYDNNKINNSITIII